MIFFFFYIGIRIAIHKHFDTNKDYVSRQAFIKKFWSAYTYEDSMLVKEEGDSQKKDSPASDILPEGF